MLVTFYHSSFYDWQPIGDVPLQPGEKTIEDAHGTILRRVLVPRATTTESDVNEASVEEIRQQLIANPDAVERRPEGILFRHFEDGVLPFHIPPGTITGVTCSDAGWEPKLVAYFVNEPAIAPEAEADAESKSKDKS